MNSKSTFVHGDVAQGDLLVKNGRLSGVIDLGILGTGDPSCDLVIAGTFFFAERAEKYLLKIWP